MIRTFKGRCFVVEYFRLGKMMYEFGGCGLLGIRFVYSLMLCGLC